MYRRLVIVAALAVAVAQSQTTAAQELAPISLPAPQKEGGLPLMQALAIRSTSRAFATEPVSPQLLANLLWAGWGINRPQEGKRTAPSARNWQEIDLVVVTASGAYLYDAASNTLKPLVAGDLRALTGVQEFVKDAPVTLVFVADSSRMQVPPAELERFAWADAAFVSQNVSLFCASEGLATGVRAMLDRSALAKALKLRETQLIAFAQSVGWPKGKSSH
jgi:nitroreductase